MATYNSRQDDTVVFGREFKLNVSMDPDGDYHMEDVEFFCQFTAGGKCVTLTKSDMIRVDANNYVAPLDSKAFGKGCLCIRYEADIPDDAFADGYRHEKFDIPTKIKIV